MRCASFTILPALLILSGLALAEQIYKLEAIQPLGVADKDLLSAIWSPDGSLLALTEAKYTGILLMDTRTAQITALTQEACAGYRFAWSPDGRFIAYKALVDPETSQKAIKLADLRTGEIRQLSAVSADVGVPTWLTDGRVGYTFEGDFLIVDDRGRILETIPDIASNVVAASNDGRWLLYNDSQDRMWAYHLTDGERFQATPDGQRFYNPVWSPTEPVAIVDELGGPFSRLDIATGTLGALDDGNHYAWSPDGQRIVYDVTTDDGHDITSADIYLINRDGSGKTALTATSDELEMYPSWSPQDRIVYSRPDGRAFMAKLVAQ
jgi:Tol biopolymer transport system component